MKNIIISDVTVHPSKALWKDSWHEHAALIFEIGTDKSLFDGLYISQNKSLCDEHMGKYPVIFLTLKGVEGLTFAKAKSMLSEIIKDEADRHYILNSSEALTSVDREAFMKILTGNEENIENSLNFDRLSSHIKGKHLNRRRETSSTPVYYSFNTHFVSQYINYFFLLS